MAHRPAPAPRVRIARSTRPDLPCGIAP